MEKTTASNVNEGKVYQLSTPRGTRFGLFGTVTSSVTLMDNGMKVFMLPKKLNKLPEIKYKDIASIEVKSGFSWSYAAFAVLTCITVIIPLLCIWVGRFKKINISLKNGQSTIIYNRASKTTDELINEIKKRM